MPNEPYFILAIDPNIIEIVLEGMHEEDLHAFLYGTDRESIIDVLRIDLTELSDQLHDTVHDYISDRLHRAVKDRISVTVQPRWRVPPTPQPQLRIVNEIHTEPF